MKEFAYKLVKGIPRKDIPRDKRDVVNDLIALKIVSDGKIIKLKSKYRIGKLDVTKKGVGFLEVWGLKEKDLLIESWDLNGASKGDIVIVEKLFNKRGRPKAKVVYILEKAFSVTIAYLTFEIKNGKKVPVLKNIKTQLPIFVNERKKALKKLPENAVFKVDNYTNKIIEVLGVLDDPWVDEKISLGLYNKKEEFSKGAILEAKAFGDFVDKSMYPDRVDLTKLSFCTIDPESAKDHDDAIYFDKEKNELYVAIADVSEYVYLNGNIDKEAKERGFSIYFPHKAVPMLPRELSENICSLKEREDRLAFVFKITLNNKNEVIKEELFEAVINSKRKYSYDRVDEFLAGEFNNLDETDKEILDWLLPLWERVKDIRFKRLKTGLDFASDEIRMKLDENGEIESVEIEEETPSHSLIEDCMLLANKAAAKIIDFGIFRVHEKPSKSSIDDLYENLLALGIEVSGEDFVENVKEIQKQAQELGIKKEVDKLIIRAQQQARYEATNLGHYALGFERYTHFTSPIRRYSDLTLHRLLKATLRNDKKQKEFILRNIEALVVKISELEREAMKVEWDFYDRKYARYAAKNKNIGKVFKGVIEDTEIPPIAKILEDKLLGARVFLKDKKRYNLFEKVDIEITNANIASAKIKGKVIVQE